MAEGATTTFKVSTGRGGAGNIRTSESQLSPKLVPRGSQTPNILQPVFSTGRGGAGNMRRNVDAKLTRKAQDVDDDGGDHICGSDEDYIGPVKSSGDEGSGNRIVSALSGKSTASNHLNKHRTKSNEQRPRAIVLGRGGAGNIISPTASKKSNKKKGKKVEKKGFWGSLKGIFT